ncbi:MAG: hypothetical protein QOF48_2203 [Verrucomicrobiota bacterium]|jgi:hypothetical protein
MRSNIFALLCCLPLFAAVAADAPATFKVGEFTFTRPAEWEWVESSSPMRKAQLKILGDDKKSAAEIVFFHFGAGQGGDTKANIDRWLGQFEEPRPKLNPKTEETTVAGRKINYVSAEGTYMEGPPGGQKTPRPGYALRGAIVESDDGSVFIKLSGPAALAQKSQAAFRKMVENAAAKK